MIIRRGTINKTGERIRHESSDTEFNQSIVVRVYEPRTNKIKSLFRSTITWDKEREI